MRVAFLGLGIMGSRMAGNLAGKGFELTVWNRTAERGQEFAAAHDGVRVGATPSEAAASAEVVLTMVVDGPQVRELLLGEQFGAARMAAPGTVFVDCSTIGIEQARSIGSELTARGFGFLDAPVTGSSPRAENGTLVFMVGGEEADFEAVKPVFEAMGTTIVRAGGIGQGQAVKVIMNSVAAINATTLGQALLVGARLGTDLDVLVELLRAGSSGSLMADLKAAPMLHHDYTTLFKLDHMLKDVRLCLDAGGAAGAEFQFASEVEEVLAASSSMGHGDDDFAALIAALEARAGFEL
jgi:3-hydroxyisobutyrate dehydrogenase